MVPLPNMPPNNRDFDLLFVAFSSVTLRLLDEDMAKHRLRLMSDPKVSDDIWPNGRVVMLRSFVPPVLPDGELAMNPVLLPDYMKHNPNVTTSGPDLIMNKRALACMSMASLHLAAPVSYRPGTVRGYVTPVDPGRNPFESVMPYPLMYTEVTALNDLYLAVKNDTPDFVCFSTGGLDGIMRRFAVPLRDLVAGVVSGTDARRCCRQKHNRGWFRICNLELSPIMSRLRDLLIDDSETDDYPEVSIDTKAVMFDLIQAMTVAVLANDERFFAAETRYALVKAENPSG